MKVPSPTEALATLRPVQLIGGEQTLFAVTADGKVGTERTHAMYRNTQRTHTPYRDTQRTHTPYRTHREHTPRTKTHTCIETCWHGIMRCLTERTWGMVEA